MDEMDKKWFDLRHQIKRTYAQSVWIPLSIGITEKSGEYGSADYRDVFEGAHSVVVPLDRRELAETYSWSDEQDSRPWAEAGIYKPSDVHSHNEEVDVGFRLALRQPVPGEQRSVWHLHQDFVLALGLLREGDSWVRPEENYAEVARLRRDQHGQPVGIEAKSEFLRDYLRARNAAMKIASFRSRAAIVEDLDDIDFPQDGRDEEVSGGRLEERAWAIDRSGSPFGSGVAVFKASRNDVDPELDVPIMGPETNENTDSSSWTFKRTDGKLYQVMSEFWRDEWVEPAPNSVRVRRDRVPSSVTFVVEADGTRMNADDLDDEDIGRWLWFSPEVVPAILSRRGASLQWYTRDTGGILTISNPTIHFGLNDKFLVTVYARDVARLPEWERRFWAGFNVSPEAGVSAELLSAQVKVEVAKTQAPEKYLPRVLHKLNVEWRGRFGTALLREHDQIDEILSRIHRFRAMDRSGFLSLAKDIARLTADAIDAGVAQKVAPPEKGQKLGSLKSFEKALATLQGEEIAHKVVGPLFAAYDLRLSDAHLPKSDFLDALKTLGISDDEPPLMMGFKLLHAVVSSLNSCVLLLMANDASE